MENCGSSAAPSPVRDLYNLFPLQYNSVAMLTENVSRKHYAKGVNR